MKWFWLICFVATNVLGGVVGKLAAQSGLTPAQIFLSFNKYLIYMVLLFIFNWIFFINALKHFQLNVVNPVGTVFTIIGTLFVSVVFFQESLGFQKITGILLAVAGGFLILFDKS